MIVTNQVMWPPVCNRWRLDDEPRWPLDSLMYLIYFCSAKKILVSHSNYLVEKPPLEFYDIQRKARVYRKYVEPILETAFFPFRSNPWDVDPKGRLASIWDDIVEFYTNLIWCSQLKMPFVFDIDRLRSLLTAIRNDLIKENILENPTLLNDLLAILHLYKRCEVHVLLPSESSSWNPVEMAMRLRRSVKFQILSRETYTLGLHRAKHLSFQLDVIRDKAEEVAKSRTWASLLTIGKTAVNLFLGTPGKLGSESVTQIVKLVFGKPFCPPIFDLVSIENGFDSIYYSEGV